MGEGNMLDKRKERGLRLMKGRRGQSKKDDFLLGAGIERT